MNSVLTQYTDRVIQTTRMPFLKHDGVCSRQVFIGETEFIDEKDETNQVKLYIYLAGPKFNEEKMAADFSSNGPTFVQNLKSYVEQHDRASLAQQTQQNGRLSLVLDGVKVELKHKEHFFVDAREKMTSNNK